MEFNYGRDVIKKSTAPTLPYVKFALESFRKVYLTIYKITLFQELISNNPHNQRRYQIRIQSLPSKTNPPQLNNSKKNNLKIKNILAISL